MKLGDCKCSSNYLCRISTYNTPSSPECRKEEKDVKKRRKTKNKGKHLIQQVEQVEQVEEVGGSREPSAVGHCVGRVGGGVCHVRHST